MMKFFLLLFVLAFNITTYANSSIKKLFSDYFYHIDLSARHCGQNISNFVKYLSKNNFQDIKGITIVSMTSPNNPWSFGNVVAMQARWSGKNNGIYSHFNYAFHVFAIHQGEVYDFSFMEEPTVLPLDRYLSTMYIPPVAFAINGSSFRTRGMGPLYTPSHALTELKDSSFKIFNTNNKGDYIDTQISLSYSELLNEFDKN